LLLYEHPTLFPVCDWSLSLVVSESSFEYKMVDLKRNNLTIRPLNVIKIGNNSSIAQPLNQFVWNKLFVFSVFPFRYNEFAQAIRFVTPNCFVCMDRVLSTYEPFPPRFKLLTNF
jgi:hypothetical protein